jgi:hypothetical protein
VALGLDKMMSSFDGHTLMSCGFYFILFYFIYLFLEPMLASWALHKLSHSASPNFCRFFQFRPSE